MLTYLSLVLALAATTMAQSAIPSNATLAAQVTDLQVLYSSSNVAVVYPLKAEVGLGGSFTVLNVRLRPTISAGAKLTCSLVN